MATYADETTIAERGDIVKCGKPNCNCGQRDKYVVDEVTSCRVRLRNETLFSRSDLFDLISRAPAPEPEQPAVNHEQSPEPLVKWPEERKLRMKHVCTGDLFAFEHEKQKVCLRTRDGYIVLFDGTPSPARILKKDPGECEVRVVRLVQSPKFEVIDT